MFRGMYCFPLQFVFNSFSKQKTNYGRALFLFKHSIFTCKYVYESSKTQKRIHSQLNSIF